MDKNELLKMLEDNYEEAKINSRRNKPDYVCETGDWYEYGYWCGIKEYLANLITCLQNSNTAELLEEHEDETAPEGKNVEFAHDFLDYNKLTKADFIYKCYTEINEHMFNINNKFDIDENISTYDDYVLSLAIIDTAFGLLEEYLQKENN